MDSPTHCCYACGELFEVRHAGPDDWLVRPFGDDLAKTWQLRVPVCPFDCAALQPFLIEVGDQLVAGTL